LPPAPAKIRSAAARRKRKEEEVLAAAGADKEAHAERRGYVPPRLARNKCTPRASVASGVYSAAVGVSRDFTAARSDDPIMAV